MSTAAEEWTRFCKAALLQVCRDSRRHVDAWARLPALIRNGALRRQANGWYQVSDLGAFWRARLGCAVQDVQLDGTGRVTQVTLLKPDQLTRALAAMDELRVRRAQAAELREADPLN